jgi:hypothetical protein
MVKVRSTYLEKSNAYRILVENPKENTLLETPGRRSEESINLREKYLCGMDWIHLARHRDQWMGSCEHGNEL